MTGCIVGSPRPPVCVWRGPHLKQHPWAGGHDPVMLPPAPLSAKPQGNRLHYVTGRQRPQSSLSFFLISSKSQGKVHKVHGQCLAWRQKRDQKTSHCPSCPDKRDGNLLGKLLCKGPLVIGNAAQKEEAMGEDLPARGVAHTVFGATEQKPWSHGPHLSSGSCVRQQI